MDLSNYRIRTQIIVLFIIIVIIVLTIVIISNLTLINYMKDAFLSDSMNVLIKETNMQFTSQSALYDQRLKTIINQIFRKQRMFQNIYLFVDENVKILQIQPPFYCPPNITQVESKSFFCLMAYQYDQTNYTNLQTEIKKQFQVISLFHQTILMFDPSQFIATGIAYTSNDEIPILGTWPALNSTLSYNAHQRSWYLSHIKQMGNGNQYLFSDLFIVNKIQQQQPNHITFFIIISKFIQLFFN